MLHFPSSLHNGGSGGSGSTGGVPRRTDSLNATQTKAAGSQQNQFFLTIEQELHDARRVSSHGQEEDLRYALNMVIERVTELSTLLSEAFKSKAELELQLNVAKSNLQLVIANNEMLEEALKSGGGSGRDVGWRRASGSNTHTLNNRESVSSIDANSPVSGSSPTDAGSSSSGGGGGSNSRFFKTFFNGRPGTPTTQGVHLTSPSMPSLSGVSEEEALSAALQAAKASAEKARHDLEQERKVAEAARKEAAVALRDKAALEAEVESLSQALFEEANQMVASERKRRAEVEGELKKLQPIAEELKRTRGELREARGVKEALEEALEEKAALRSALRLIEGQNVELRSASRLSQSSSVASDLDQGEREGSPEQVRWRHKRSSSEIATKSPTHSPVLSSSAQASPYLPTAPSPQIPQSVSSSSASSADEEDGDADITFVPTPSSLHPSVELDLQTPRRTGRDGEDVEQEEADGAGTGKTPRRSTLSSLPSDLDPDSHAEADSLEGLKGEAMRGSVDPAARARSPAPSPPPTARAYAHPPGDPWSDA